MATKLIGERIKRKEDPRLITGTASYVDDIKLPNIHHVAFLRSIYGHAKINKIDVSEARKLPGVVAVLTHEDIKGVLKPMPCVGGVPDMHTPEHYPLSGGKVRFVGEAIAAVVANDRYVARDALDLINVDYEPLPVVVDMEKALEKGAPLLYEEYGENRGFTWKISGGDIDKAFQEADRVVKLRLVNQRVAPIPLETRAVLAQYQDRGVEGELTVWTSTQIPHGIRTSIAGMLNLPEHRVRVIAPEVGGGFGCKVDFYGEEVLIPYLAMKLKVPVKWVEGRRENIQATDHGRDQINYIEAAVKNDGTVVGLRVKVLADMGAYYQLLSPAIPTLTGLMMCGPYKIPNVSMEVLGVFTNKMTTDAYRGAGRPEATYLLERTMDAIAAELNLDPVEVRMKNFIQPQEFPYKTATGLVYDSGNYQAALQKALDHVGYKKLREEQKKLREQGQYMGIGISSYVEICAFGPSAATATGGWESATVRIEPTGKVTVLTGASPHGQGQETTFAQIVADGLGLTMEDITVQHGDTAVVQYGIGTFGSRATAVGGTAVYLALQKVKEKASKFAAHMLKVDPKGLVFRDGKIFPENNPEKSVTLTEVGLAAYLAKDLPPDTEPGLVATAFYEPKNFTYPFGTHIAVVDIDPETGQIKFRRYVAVDDCGNIINMLTVHGQVHGGIAQGLGQALYEEIVYDENGQLLTGSFMDYCIPKAHHLPKFELDYTVTPTDVNPLGAKGVGEAGTIGSTPAIVNAVVDALAHLGVRNIDMPLKPEKIWKAIRDHAKK
jgi:carbon-monoxide dehydrogenase large subunit